jgi:trk system potassium uptake protein TrkH
MRKRFEQSLALVHLIAIIMGFITLLIIPALILSVVLGERVMIRAFAAPFGVCAAVLLPVIFLTRGPKARLTQREGFLLVFLTWVFACLFGAFPYYLSGCGVSFTNSVFESTGGFATTGATLFNDVEILPRSLLVWRACSHWSGGMGIILLTVALLPLLGVGGFQLIKAESPGPEKEKLTPRITAAAKSIWIAYALLTVILIILYTAGGMTFFDAVCHGLTIMATGGVSTHNNAYEYFNSTFIDGVSTDFMILASVNFNVYYRLYKKKFRDLFENTETKAYLLIFLIASLIIAIDLIPTYGSFGEAWRYGSFQAASIISTTGSPRVDYTTWPALAQAVLFALMFIGGCSGSTAGGVKVIRWVVLWKQMGNEMRRILYPQGVFSIQLNHKVGRKDVVYGVAGFLFLYMAVVGITTLAGAAAGVDIFSSFSAALAVIGNVGLGFGAAGPRGTFALFPDWLKWFYSFMMLVGRLELWTVLILFSPEYWKR